MTQEHILRNCVVEQPKSGPQHGLAAAEYVPSNTGARAEILVIRLVEPRKRGRSHLRLGPGSCVGRRVKAGHQKIAEQIVLLRDYAEIIPAKPIVQGDPRRQVEAILNIPAIIVLERVASCVARVLESAVDIPGKKG